MDKGCTRLRMLSRLFVTTSPSMTTVASDQLQIDTAKETACAICSYLLRRYILGFAEVGVGVVTETVILPPQSLHLKVRPPFLTGMMIFSSGGDGPFTPLASPLSVTVSSMSLVASPSSNASCFLDFASNSVRLCLLLLVFALFVHSEGEHLSAPYSSEGV